MTFYRSLVLCAVVFFAITRSIAQEITITDADLKNGTYNWTADNTYILDGFVFLEAGGVLNIEAGTIIKGRENPSIQVIMRLHSSLLAVLRSSPRVLLNSQSSLHQS